MYFSPNPRNVVFIVIWREIGLKLWKLDTAALFLQSFIVMHVRRDNVNSPASISVPGPIKLVSKRGLNLQSASETCRIQTSKSPGQLRFLWTVRYVGGVSCPDGYPPSKEWKCGKGSSNTTCLKGLFWPLLSFYPQQPNQISLLFKQ